MDYMLEREKVAVDETVYDGTQEQPVDMDLSLPDYCPDIQRILKCQIYPRITSRSILGDRLMIDGNYTVRVFYLDPDGTCVRCCESGDSYSAEIALKQPADNARILSAARVEYINCRATSPRKLDIHGAFSLCSRVICPGQGDLVSNIAGDDVEQRKETLTISQPVGFSQQQFSVDEVLELGQGKPPADSILRSDAFAVLQDVKITPGKLMIRGEACVKFLYSSSGDSESLETMEYSLPFSQVLDCGGVTDDCLCDVKLETASVEAQIKNDYSGDKTFFDTQVKIFASARALKKSQVTFVNDAYSKKYDMKLESKPKTLESLEEIVSETFLHSAELSADKNTVSKVFDVWSELGSVSAEASGGNVKFKGKYSLCVLAADSENKPFYFERLLDFECIKQCSSSGNLKCEADVRAGAVSYRITGKGIETKTELRLSAGIYQSYSVKAISAASADETKPIARDTAALCLYFADAGENLWNIAREYRTSLQSIRSENGLTGDAVENRGMLLIPM